MTETPDDQRGPEDAPTEPTADAPTTPETASSADVVVDVDAAVDAPDESDEPAAEETAAETTATGDASTEADEAPAAAVAPAPSDDLVPSDGQTPPSAEPVDAPTAAAEPDAGLGAAGTTGPVEGDSAADAAAQATDDAPSASVTPDTDAADETDAADDPATPAAAAAPAPSPGPRPTPRPGPRPPLPSAMRPRPPQQRPAASAGPATTTPAAPAITVLDDAVEAAAAATFGRVDDEGTVYVREAAGERAVGQFPDATPDEALALYVRRFLDLQAKVVLFEARLTATDLAVKEIDQTLARLTTELAEPAAVGDLDALRTRLDALRSVAAERRAAVDAERAAVRQVALEARTAVVEKAEKIAGTDPSRMQWRPAGEQLRVLLDEWKEAQRSGPRLDRTSEESLWKRFSHARTTFDRERRHYFAELETRNSGAKAAKEELVREAERLADSTDWGATAAAYRDLMTAWKAAGRASRADDDALWARFRGAQDRFFQARDELNAATDREFAANLEVKESILAEAEALDPKADLAGAKAALRSIQDRWEAAGKVPRDAMHSVESRLRAVEAAVRDADQAQWHRTNPETRARAEGALSQLESAIAGLEADLASAEASGNARKATEARAALDARRSWLEQVKRAADEARG